MAKLIRVELNLKDLNCDKNVFINQQLNAPVRERPESKKSKSTTPGLSGIMSTRASDKPNLDYINKSNFSSTMNLDKNAGFQKALSFQNMLKSKGTALQRYQTN